MFETVEKEPSLGKGMPETEVPFGATSHLVPVGNQDRAERSITDLMADSPLQEAMDAIAVLQETLDQKEQALIKSTIATSGLQQQIEQQKTQNDHLRKKLTTVVKAHEALVQKVAEAENESPVQEKQIPESVVAHMKEQWRVAQKSMEREHNRLRGELAKAKAGWHQTSQELETQTRALRSEAARASHQIANLEREVDSARTIASKAGSSAKGGNMFIRLSATSAITAVIMLALGVWWQYAHDGQGHSDSPRLASSAPAPAAAATPVVPVRGSAAASSGSLSAITGSRGAFQKSLSRLNNSLYGPIGVTPEQILRAVRDANAKTNPNVCNFQWNNGQPALYFGGAQESLESSLDHCSDAVEKFLHPPATPAPALSSKK